MIFQTFTIFQDNPENNENAVPAKKIESRTTVNDENLAPPPVKSAKSSFPPPPPAHLIPTMPLATSSPAPAGPTRPALAAVPVSDQLSARERASSASSSGLEEFDACALYAKSSASNFRVNDSISSTTTNEDCDELDLEEDVNENGPVAEHALSRSSAHEEEEGVDLEARLLQSLNSEYSLDILRSCMTREVAHMPKWNYMTKQPDITFTMRSILIDWLVEVGEEYKLNTETLFLAVTYIDKFLSYMSVQRNKLQLVGTACMFIAA